VRAALNGILPRSGDRIHVAIRPEAIHCTPDGQIGVNSLPGRINQRIFKGNHTSLKIEVAPGCYLNALVDPATASHLSDPHVWVQWNENSAVILQD
jgi:spermidine/putrescine transport system ATP-binding protein